MSSFRLTAVWLATALLIAIPAARAQNAAGSTRQLVKNSLARLKVEGGYPLSSLIQISVVDGLLHGAVAPDLPSQSGFYRVDVEGSSATWTVRGIRLGRASNINCTMINRYDFDAPPDQFWNVSFMLRDNYLALIATRGDAADGLRVRLTQADHTLSLSCTNLKNGGEQTTFLASAASLRELQGRYPKEVRQYVGPLLQTLTGRSVLRPGSTDIYRVFTAIPADPAMSKKLDDLLPRLAADSFTARNQATRDLAALGAPGVLAALRRDNADLSPEAINRVTHFLESQSTMGVADPASRLKDGPFLLDCMDDEDPAVRQAARKALENLTHAPVEFDPSLPREARAQAVDHLRTTLEPVLHPTTRRAK